MLQERPSVDAGLELSEGLVVCARIRANQDRMLRPMMWEQNRPLLGRRELHLESHSSGASFLAV